MKAVLVKWIDAMSDDEWKPIGDIAKMVPDEVWTLGWLVDSDGDDCIVVVRDYNQCLRNPQYDPHGSAHISISKHDIISIEELHPVT